GKGLLVEKNGPVRRKIPVNPQNLAGGKRCIAWMGKYFHSLVRIAYLLRLDLDTEKVRGAYPTVDFAETAVAAFITDVMRGRFYPVCRAEHWSF
ncbi:hypothetical protein, partial [Methylobacter sp.]|uniref:hypothetical protein n=1 Tax=Methylobacter sp. TaxID=2051955 RepID=UPI003DA67150